MLEYTKFKRHYTIRTVHEIAPWALTELPEPPVRLRMVEPLASSTDTRTLGLASEILSLSDIIPRNEPTPTERPSEPSVESRAKKLSLAYRQREHQRAQATERASITDLQKTIKLRVVADRDPVAIAAIFAAKENYDAIITSSLPEAGVTTTPSSPVQPLEEYRVQPKKQTRRAKLRGRLMRNSRTRLTRSLVHTVYGPLKRRKLARSSLD